MMSVVDCSFIDQSILQEDEWLGLFFMDIYGYSIWGDQCSGGVIEVSSFLGGFLRCFCGWKGFLYYMGQLYFVVCVVDFLQYINQMKMVEGYGFKQEYESFFEGWDVIKKKDKVKGSWQELMFVYDWY